MSGNGNPGFGRRQPAHIKAGPAAASSPPRSGAPDATVGQVGAFEVVGLFGTALGRGFLIVVGIVLFLGAVHVAAMKGFGKALDRHWQENVGYPAIEDAYNRAPRRDAMLEQVHNDCKSRSDFINLDSSRARALAEFDGLYVGESTLDRAAFYLSCLSGQKPERFCTDLHRAHLVAALKDYYRLMVRVREERMLTLNSPFAAERMALLRPSGSIRTGAAAAPSTQTDERVIAGLRTLLIEGYLSRRDLAPVLGSSGDLDRALRAAEPRRAGCA
jgi:hypothetical protein